MTLNRKHGDIPITPSLRQELTPLCIPCVFPTCGVGPAGWDTGRIRLDQVQARVSGWNHQRPALGRRTRKCWSPVARRCERCPPWSPYLWTGLSLRALEAIGCSARGQKGFSVWYLCYPGWTSSWHRHDCGGRSLVLSYSTSWPLVSISILLP